MFDNNAIVMTFVIYLLVMLALGVLAWRRTVDLSDYLLGGRKLGPAVTALSAGASDMSGWLLLGLPGYAYLAGFEAGWIALGLVAGTYLNWRLVAPRLRIQSEQLDNALTLADYFERRFADSSHVLRILSAGLVLLFFLFYTSSGLVAGGKLFNTVFGIDYHWAVLSGAVVIVSYTFLGGFLAVSWTDFVQGMLMFCALLIVPVMAIVGLGGWSATTAAMAKVSPQLLDAYTGVDGKSLGLIAILSLLAWGLGYFGQPHILARFKAIRSSDELPRARRIAMSWVSLCMLGALLAGFSGIGMLDPALRGADSEKVFMQLIGLLLHPVVAGICLAAILAAIMSTADSQLLVASSALTRDLYKPFLRKQASDKETVWVGRAGVVLIAMLATWLAMDPDSKVLELVAYAWAGFGAAFGPALLLSLHWAGMTRSGALAGMLTGGATVIIWKQLEGGLFDAYELLPGFVFAFIMVVIVSRLTGKRDTAII
ncbi:MAG: sodium/proline symporter PutP [Granulosicoccaceae bacterium]|jgi:sodium/proline symporter